MEIFKPEHTLQRRYTLVNADCFEWLRQQPDRSFHGVITDPPFAIVEFNDDQLLKKANGSGGVWRIPPSMGGHERAPLPRFTVFSDLELRALEQYFQEFAEILLPKLVPGAHVFIAATTQLSHLVFSALSRGGLERRGEVVRLIRTLRGGDRPKNAHDEFSNVSVSPRSCWEPWGIFRAPLDGRVQDNLRKWGTGGLKRLSSETPFLDVIPSEKTPKLERVIADHPSIKPQSFLRHLASHILPLDTGIVLDPFSGSGSTIAACESLSIQSVGVERNSAFYKMSCDAVPLLADLYNGNIAENRRNASQKSKEDQMQQSMVFDQTKLYNALI